MSTQLAYALVAHFTKLHYASLALERSQGGGDIGAPIGLYLHLFLEKTIVITAQLPIFGG